MLSGDDKPRQIAPKFRASLDPADADGYELLRRNDEIQNELRSKVQSRAANTPLETQMVKAEITIKSLTNPALKLNKDQRETLAKSYATIGRYDLAAETTRKHKKLYKAYWAAVWLDDNSWCLHPAAHKYVREYVFSIREGKELSLLACGVCRSWNVLDIPDDLKQRKQTRDGIKGSTVGMTIEQAKAFHQQSVTKG